MKTLKQSILSIAVGLVLAAGISYGWTTPTASPPLGNVSAPINESINLQTKLGSLDINGLFQAWGAAVFKGNVTVDKDLTVTGSTTINGTLKIPLAASDGKVLTSNDSLGNAGWKELFFHGSQSFYRNGIFTVPSGVTNITVTLVGGGGGGGGGGCQDKTMTFCNDGEGYGGGGGGGGGGGQKLIFGLVVQAGQKYSVDVGESGMGGLGAYWNEHLQKGSPGEDGKASKFYNGTGDILFSVNGGSGGLPGNLSAFGVGGVSTSSPVFNEGDFYGSYSFSGRNGTIGGDYVSGNGGNGGISGDGAAGGRGGDNDDKGQLPAPSLSVAVFEYCEIGLFPGGGGGGGFGSSLEYISYGNYLFWFPENWGCDGGWGYVLVEW